MGKSAGKWIKTVLFRKKTSKASITKEDAVEIEKEAGTTPMVSSGDMLSNPDTISDPAPHSSEMGSRNSESVKEIITSSLYDSVSGLAAPRGADTGGASDRLSIIRLEPAAKKEVIIRLQALIRGHLVRRQAIATFRCMRGILKLQALIRNQNVKILDAGNEAADSCSQGNAFILKLLASPCSTAPMKLHYDRMDLNSSWNWLERWSSFLLPKPLSQQKSIPHKNINIKQSSNRTVERDLSRPKQSALRISAAKMENNSFTMPEFGKSKRSTRKPLSNQAEAMQGNPMTELERVKQNLRKITAFSPGAPVVPEPVTKKPNSSPDGGPEKIGDNSQEETCDPTVKMMKESEKVEIEMYLEPSIMLENSIDEKLHFLENNTENILAVDDGLNYKDEGIIKEDQRTTSRKRRSFATKQEIPENLSQNTPMLPSYMAATESGKAKARGQGSLRFSQDEDENGFARRHSLPFSNDGKLNSISPRKERLVANGKGRSKSERQLLPFRDTNEKVTQPAWRR